MTIKFMTHDPLALTISGITVSICSFMATQINAVLSAWHFWFSLKDIAAFFGIVATFAVIWMNVENALLKRSERRKLNHRK